MKKLFIIRGVPGSGKSTLAKSLTPHVFEADQYFVGSDGVYRFDKGKIKEAHVDCQQRVEFSMQACTERIAVANTFVKKWEYEPYLKLALKYGYDVEIRICKGGYQNVHGVPADVVERMRNNFEKEF